MLMFFARVFDSNKIVLFAILILVACVFVTGCSANAFRNLKVQVGASPIRVDGRNFQVFTVAALNTGEESIRLQFSSGMQFDFVVMSDEMCIRDRGAEGNSGLLNARREPDPSYHREHREIQLPLAFSESQQA